jgi:hypothetical protein
MSFQEVALRECMATGAERPYQNFFQEILPSSGYTVKDCLQGITVLRNRLILISRDFHPLKASIASSIPIPTSAPYIP